VNWIRVVNEIIPFLLLIGHRVVFTRTQIKTRYFSQKERIVKTLSFVSRRQAGPVEDLRRG